MSYHDQSRPADVVPGTNLNTTSLTTIAEARQLGKLKTSYGVSTVWMTVGKVFLWLGISIYVLMAALALCAAADTTVFVLGVGLIPLALFSGLGLLIYRASARQINARRSWRLNIYENGLICRTTEITALHWHEIKRIVHSSFERRTFEDEHKIEYIHTYRIYSQDGTELFEKHVFDDTFGHQLKTIKTIELGTAPYMVEEALKQYHTGAPVAFGAASVSTGGIALNGKLLPWAEFQGLALTNMDMVIKKKGSLLAWEKCPMGDVDNYEALKELVTYITQKMR